MIPGGGAKFGALSGLDRDAQALFTRMSPQPNATRKRLISDTISALKKGGIWPKIHVVWVLAAHTDQAARLNWKANSFTISGGDGAITENVGLTSGYLDTGYSFGSLPGYMRDNLHAAVMSRKNGSGVLAGGFSVAHLLPGPAANGSSFRTTITLAGTSVRTPDFNAGENETELFTAGSAVGEGGARRFAVVNDAVGETVTNNSPQDNSTSWLIAAFRNNSGISAGQGGYPHRMLSLGYGLTRAELSTFQTIMFRYMKAVVPGINL